MKTKLLLKLALLVALGLILFLFESLIPRPLPWVKPGLANAATLLALYIYGFRAALIVMIARVTLGSLILGTLLNPAFMLAFAGGLFATVVMGAAKKFGGQALSIFGISILGAFSHNLMQIVLAEILIVKRSEILYLMPIMLVSSLFTGLMVGLFSYLIIDKAISQDLL